MSKRLTFALLLFIAVILHSSYQTRAQEILYKLGDRGPAGGWIFYDKGEMIGGWRYMEAAPEDHVSKVTWHNGNFIETGAIVSAMGTGRSNTEKIIKALGDGNYAAKICSDYRGGGKSDWFLPSKIDLLTMYMNLHKKGIGRFAGSIYWSSTEHSAKFAWLQNFGNSEQIIYNKNYYELVRAIRSF